MTLHMYIQRLSYCVDALFLNTFLHSEDHNDIRIRTFSPFSPCIHGTGTSQISFLYTGLLEHVTWLHV